MNVLPLDKKLQILASLVDGCSIRATSRLTDTHIDTIGRLQLSVGGACAMLHDKIMRDLQVSHLQIDEQWSFVHTKQKRLTPKTDPDWGDQYTFVALAIAPRAIVSYLIGKRTADNAHLFINDLRKRVLGVPHITSDGWKPYVEAIESAFGADVHFGQLVKQYEGDEKSEEHDGRFIGSQRQIITGHPDINEVHTSYIERANLTTRMSLRRFARRTNAFSKKLRNHRAAVSLFVAHYNLCRVHLTLRTTPAMELGITDHVWSMKELHDRAMAEVPPPRFRTVEFPGMDGLDSPSGLNHPPPTKQQPPQ